MIYISQNELFFIESCVHISNRFSIYLCIIILLQNISDLYQSWIFIFYIAMNIILPRLSLARISKNPKTRLVLLPKL